MEIRITPDPWERQPSESAQAFRAFASFRDLGATRTVSDAYRSQTGRPQAKRAPSWWTGWSAKFEWRPRAFAWDAELDRRGREAKIGAIQEMNRRQAEMGREMQRLAGMALRVMRPITTETIDENGQVIRVLKTEITPQALVALAKIGVELERLAMGQATERIDMQVIEEQAEELAQRFGLTKAEVLAEAEELLRNARRP